MNDFEEQVLKEIEDSVPPSRKAAAAGLAAILQCIGHFDRNEAGKCRLILQSERRQTLIKGFTLLGKTYNISSESDLKEIGQFSAEAGSPEKIGRFEIDGVPAEKIERTIHQIDLSDRKCARYFLAHVFLCIGSIHNPSRDYFLSFEAFSDGQADQIEGLLRKDGVILHRQGRSQKTLLMTRDSAVISDVLNLLGAHRSMMDLENARIVRQVRSRVNRNVNCETSNIRKTAVASSRQVEEIRLLRKSPKWETIPESLREIADLREKYPEDSLQELGAMLNPPIGKSGVNHRLRRLSGIVEELQKETK